MGTVTRFANLSTIESSAYEWNEEFTKGQPQAYRAQNVPYITARRNLQNRLGLSNISNDGPRNCKDLIKEFLAVMGDAESPHGPSIYYRLELESFCAVANLSTLENGFDDCVSRSLALLDDRSRVSSNTVQVTDAGYQRTNVGPLSASALLQALRKKRYDCENEPNAGRRLLYITDPDCWVVLILAITASNHQALFLTDFFYKYLSFKTSLGIHRPPRGIALFALEFHLSFLVWRDGGPLFLDSRRKHNGKPLRKSYEMHDLNVEDLHQPFSAYVYEAQMSCLVTGLDHDSWVAYFFIDTYYQGESSSESVDRYHSEASFRPDPLMAGTSDANLPIWTPREYFLTVYECRLKQVKHAFHNLVSRLLLKLEPYIQEPASFLPADQEHSTILLSHQARMQKMNEACRLLRTTIHSISKTVEVWDRFSSGDAAYLADILKPRINRADSVPPLTVVAMIEHHINDLRDLQRRAEEQQELCAGLARELEIQLIVEDNENTTDQQKTGYWMMVLAILGVVVLPFQATASLFSMQPGILPTSAYTGKAFAACWLSLTLVFVVIGLSLKLIPFRVMASRRQHRISEARQLEIGAYPAPGSALSLMSGNSTREDGYEMSSLSNSNDSGLRQTPRTLLD